MTINLTDEELKAELERREKEREEQEDAEQDARWAALEIKFADAIEKLEKACNFVYEARKEAEKISIETGIPLHFSGGVFTPNTYKQFNEEEKEYLSENGYSGVNSKWYVDAWYHSASC